MAYPAINVLDPSTGEVLFAFNDELGTNNPQGIVTRIKEEDFDLGVPEISMSTLATPNIGGGLLTKREALFAQTTARVHANGASQDALRLATGYLSRLLESPGVLSWQPDENAEVSFIDYLGSSEVPSLYRDGPSVLQLMMGNRAIPGFLVSLLRQPYLRTDTLLASVNKLSNSWPLKEGATAGRPLNWTWLSATDISAESIDNDGYHFTIATGAVRSLQQTTAVGSFASGDVITKSFYVQASAASIVQAQAAVQFRQSDGTTNVGSEHVGTLTAVGTDLVRVSVTTTAAGVLTSRALVSVRFDNTAATSVDVTVQRIQAEVSSTASEFRMGVETLSNDPAGFCTLLVWNPGDADARADTFLRTSGDWEQVLVALVEGEELSAVADNLYIPSSDTTAGLKIHALDLETTRVTGLGATYTDGDALRTSTFSSGASLVNRYVVGFATQDGSTAIVDTLQGRTYILIGRFRATAAAIFLLDMQPLAIVAPDIVTDTVTFAPGTAPGISVGTFYDIPLGPFTLPEDPGFFEAHLRAGRSSGTGNLEIDHAYLVPVDQMVLIDTVDGDETIRLNAHESEPASIFNPLVFGGPLRHIKMALTQGSVPVIPPGLSFLWVSRWRTEHGEQLLGEFKESVLADTIEAWTDITPQRHQ